MIRAIYQLPCFALRLAAVEMLNLEKPNMVNPEDLYGSELKEPGWFEPMALTECEH